MKRIKFKPNKKVEDIAEICKLASNYFYIFTSLYNETCEIELQDFDSNVDEALDSIRNEMSSANTFKESNNSTLKKILKDNYIMVDLYKSYRCLDVSIKTILHNEA